MSCQFNMCSVPHTCRDTYLQCLHLIFTEFPFIAIFGIFVIHTCYSYICTCTRWGVNDYRWKQLPITEGCWSEQPAQCNRTEKLVESNYLSTEEQLEEEIGPVRPSSLIDGCLLHVVTTSINVVLTKKMLPAPGDSLELVWLNCEGSGRRNKQTTHIFPRQCCLQWQIYSTRVHAHTPVQQKDTCFTRTD